MICPNCSAACLLEDGYCHNCHQPLPSGLRRSTLVSWSCGVGAMLGVLFIVLIAPIESGTHLAASLCCAVPSAFAFACVAGLFGWVIGRVACDH